MRLLFLFRRVISRGLSAFKQFESYLKFVDSGHDVKSLNGGSSIDTDQMATELLNSIACICKNYQRSSIFLPSHGLYSPACRMVNNRQLSLFWL